MRRVINHISQWAALTLLVQERWQKRQSPFVVTIGKAPKSSEQLSYFYAECLPKLAQALYDSGEIQANSEGAAKYFIKRQVGYGSFYAFGENIYFDPDSLARATLETLSQIIDLAIDEAAKRGIVINAPKDKK